MKLGKKSYENWDEMSVMVSDSKSMRKTPIYLMFTNGNECTMTVHLSKSDVIFLRKHLKKALKVLG